MESNNFNAEASSNTSSVLSDLPETPEEIARSYTTISDDVSRALNKFGDLQEVPATPTDQLHTQAQVDGSADEYLPANSKKIQKRVAAKLVPQPTKRLKKDKWDADFVTQNPKSPLVTAPLKSILASPNAFNSLTPEQQSQIIAMIPNKQHVIEDSDGKVRISPDFLKYDPDWSYYVSRFQEDISDGKNDPAWISEAREALEERQNGDFDDFKDEEYEAFWGIKQKIASNVVAGDSSNINLNILFKEGSLRKGDTWTLRRKIAGTDRVSGTIVEKEMMIKEVSEMGLPTIHMPPGTFKMSKPEEREDIVIFEVGAPGKVENRALEEYGIMHAPNANAWKTIRVIRNNQDLGSLWDVRQTLSFRRQ